MKRVALVLALACTGCGVKLVDPCAGVSGACVALQVDAPRSLVGADSIALTTDGAGTTRTSTVATGGVTLPVAIGVVFGATARLPADVRFTVTAMRGGRTSATGLQAAHVAPGQHQTLTVTLAAPAALVDLGGVDGALDLAGYLDALDLARPSDGCMATSFMASQVAPTVEIMIVQQSGGNMAEGITSMDMSPRYTVTNDALEDVISHVSGASFGLVHFPDTSNADLGCAIGGALDVAPAPSDEAQIASKLAAIMPNNSSVGPPAIDLAASYLAGRPASARYLLVSTDGIVLSCPTFCSCSDGGPDFDTAVSNAATMGIHSFVLGVGNDPLGMQYTTTAANNGLEPNTTAGEPAYFVPNDSTALSGAINAAVARAVSCEYTLPSPPSDPSTVSVSSSGAAISRDTTHANGWDFSSGGGTIVVYGAACASLRQAGASKIDVTLGCS